MYHKHYIIKSCLNYLANSWSEKGLKFQTLNRNKEYFKSNIFIVNCKIGCTVSWSNTFDLIE